MTTKITNIADDDIETETIMRARKPSVALTLPLSLPDKLTIGLHDDFDWIIPDLGGEDW